MDIRREVEKWLEQYRESAFDVNVRPVGDYYNSEHSKIVEAQLILPYLDEEGNAPYNWENQVATHNAYTKYSKSLVEDINSEVGTSITFRELHQDILIDLCRVYIEVNCSVVDLVKLIGKYESDNIDLFYERVEEAIIDLTTKRDGYIPFHSVDSLFKDDGDRLAQLLLDEVCKSIDLLILGNEEFKI